MRRAFSHHHISILPKKPTYMPYLGTIPMSPRFASPPASPDSFSQPRPRPPRSPRQSAQIRVRNRRREYLERTPAYFNSSEHEFAGSWSLVLLYAPGCCAYFPTDSRKGPRIRPALSCLPLAELLSALPSYQRVRLHKTRTNQAILSSYCTNRVLTRIPNSRPPPLRLPDSTLSDPRREGRGRPTTWLCSRSRRLVDAWRRTACQVGS